MGNRERTVAMYIEPSKRLSELCGFPYFIRRRFTIGELLEKGMIDENDISKLARNGEIRKRIPVDRGE